MDKLLILVRHGKAQSRSLGLDDFERELTGAGRRALKAWLPKSARLLEAESARTFEFWASPSARTMQTAAIVAKVWRKRIADFPERPQALEALWSGNMREVYTALAESRADAVVVCGHNPYIEMLCEELTGCAITFATGAVASLRVADSVLKAHAEKNAAGFAEYEAALEGAHSFESAPGAQDANVGSSPASAESANADDATSLISSANAAESDEGDAGASWGGNRSFFTVAEPIAASCPPPGSMQLGGAEPLSRARLLWFVQGPESRNWRK